MYEFRLKVTRHPSPDSNATFHVAVSVEDPQLNPKGRRRIPILVVPIDAYPNVPEPWPGRPIRESSAVDKPNRKNPSGFSPGGAWIEETSESGPQVRSQANPHLIFYVPTMEIEYAFET